MSQVNNIPHCGEIFDSNHSTGLREHCEDSAHTESLENDIGSGINQVLSGIVSSVSINNTDSIGTRYRDDR